MIYAKHILIFSFIILLLVFFYSWLMNSLTIENNKYKSATSVSSQMRHSDFKILEKPKNSITTTRKSSKLIQVKEKFTAKPFMLKNQFYKCSSTDCIILAVVSCEERTNETMVMIKSAICLTKSRLLIEIFTEEKKVQIFKSWAMEWPSEVKSRVKLNVHLVKYPPGINEKVWRNMFKPCASVRLFLPNYLHDVDSLLYVDTDVLFLSSVDDIWDVFSRMNSSHMAALAQEHEDLATGWYNRFSKVPFYGKLGLNSGVMLMNLTRMRTFGWEEYLVPIQNEFHPYIRWGDQDIINIIFHYHPDKLYLLGCEYNYRSDHCRYMSVCKAVESKGVFALHGSREIFHNTNNPAFKVVYDVWDEFKFGQDLRQDLYYPIIRKLVNISQRVTCAKMWKHLVKNIESLISL